MLLELLLLIGSYNDASQESIQLYSFNQESGQFASVSGAKGVTNPTFLCTNAAQDIVYAVGEYDEDDKARMPNVRRSHTFMPSTSRPTTNTSWPTTLVRIASMSIR